MNAKELLEAATAKEPECTCSDPNIGHDESCCPWFAWMFSQPHAEQELREQAPATLAVAIKLAEAAQHSADEDCSCKARQALAEWKALGKEQRNVDAHHPPEA